MKRKAQLRALRSEVAQLKAMPGTVAAEGTLADPDDKLWKILTHGLHVGTAAGEAVGPGSAMRVPVVAAAVRAIGETLASLEPRVMRLDANGRRQEDPAHPANRIIARPNGWSSRFSLINQLAKDANLHGIAGAAVVRVNGEPRELIRIHPGSLGREIDPGTGEPTFRIGDRVRSWRDVLYVEPIPTENGETTAPLTLAREAIGFLMALQAHGSRLFGNGARPGSILSVKGNNSPTRMKNIVQAWNAAHGGGKSGGTALLPGEIDYSQLALSSVDAQYVELWGRAILDVARAFRVPPIIIGDLTNATFNNSEELGRQFVSMCIKPWCEQFADAFERVLFRDDERGRYFVEFDYQELLKPSTLQLYDALYKAATTFLTPDEARETLGRGPVPGGSHLRVPGNTVRADAPPPAPAPLPPTPLPQEPAPTPEPTLQ